jgi:uncharacterized membrane protein YjjP (DUF1212 family)
LNAGESQSPQRSQINLDQLANNPRLKIDVRTEDPADAAHRRQQELDEAHHRRRMFWWVFAVLIVAGDISLVALGVSDDADTRDWARNCSPSLSVS